MSAPSTAPGRRGRRPFVRRAAETPGESREAAE